MSIKKKPKINFLNETNYHHLYDISFSILPFFYQFVEEIVPKINLKIFISIKSNKNLLDEELLFLYYYHHQIQDHKQENIHHNLQYQISYKYKPLIEQLSRNHQQELFELYHLIDEFLMVDIYFYILHCPIEKRKSVQEKK